MPSTLNSLPGAALIYPPIQFSARYGTDILSASAGSLSCHSSSFSATCRQTSSPVSGSAL